MDSTLASPRPRTWTSVLGNLAFDLAFIAVLALSVATLFARDAWLADMISFFRPHLAVASLVLVPLALIAKSRLRLVLALVLVLFNVWPLVVRDHAAPAAAQGQTFRVLSANLLGDNREFDRFFAMVKTLDPDVVVVQEAQIEWRKALDGLATAYPYRVSKMLKNWSSVDVLSRIPFTPHYMDDLETPPILMGGGRPIRLELQPPGQSGQPIVLYAIHPPTPRTEGGWEVRNTYLATLAKSMEREKPGTPVLVAGDWNTPTWSPFFDRFLAQTGTAPADSASWPAPTRIFQEFGAPAWLGSPVDHIVVNGGMGVARFGLGPATGSDHFPIYADVAVLPRN